MNRTLRCLLASCVIGAVWNAAQAQGGGIKVSDVAGTWVGKSMVGPKDSVFVTWVLTATADGKGWTLKRANRDPVPVQIVAIGGDSIVWESGPQPSFLRPGQTVTTRTFVGLGIFRPRGVYTQSYYGPAYAPVTSYYTPYFWR